MKWSRQLVALPKINVNDEHANVVEKNRKQTFLQAPARRWIELVQLIPVVWTSDSLMFTETMQCCRGKRYANIVAEVRAESFKARSRGMMNSWRGIRTQQFLEFLERVWMWFVAQFTFNRLDDRLECKQARVTSENVRFCRPSRVDDYI